MTSLVTQYLGCGPVADRPASPSVAAGALALYCATDEGTDGVLYKHDGTAWTAAGSGGGGGGGLTDAPSDGSLYGRKDGAWETVPSGGGGGSGSAFEAAPNLPDLSGYTWVNQGPATATFDTHGAVMRTTGVPGADAIRALVTVAPTAPYHVVARLDTTGWGDYLDSGIVLYDTVSGKAQTIMVKGETRTVTQTYWNSVTSVSSHGWGRDRLSTVPKWLRVSVGSDNNTLDFYFSANGIDWVLGHSTNFAANMPNPANRVGILISPYTDRCSRFTHFSAGPTLPAWG